MPARNAVRDAEALAYRARGWTYLRIAGEMGFAGESGARAAVDRAISHSARETTDAAKSLLLADLNAAKQAVWVVLEANHVTVSQGQVVGRFAGFAKDPDTGETYRADDGKPIPVYEEIPDDAPVLAAVDRLVKINQELAKIYGAYAPVRHEVRTIGEIDARLLELAEQVGRVATGSPAEVPGSA